MDNDLGFIFQNWGIISVSMYTLSLIAVLLAFRDKVDTWSKVSTVFVIIVIPFIGWLLYLFIRLFREYKKYMI